MMHADVNRATKQPNRLSVLGSTFEMRIFHALSPLAPEPFIPSESKNRHQRPARSGAGAKAKTKKRDKPAKGRQEITQKCINCLKSSTATRERKIKAFTHLSLIHGKNAIPRLVHEVGLTSTMNAIHSIDPFGHAPEVSGYLDAAFIYAQRISIRKQGQQRISSSLLKLEKLIEDLETPRHLTRVQKQVVVQEANRHAENVLTKLEISHKQWEEIIGLVTRLKPFSKKTCAVDMMLLKAAGELNEAVNKFVLVLGDRESRKILSRIQYDILPRITVSGLMSETNEGRLRGLQTGTLSAIAVIDLYAKRRAMEMQERAENV